MSVHHEFWNKFAAGHYTKPNACVAEASLESRVRLYGCVAMRKSVYELVANPSRPKDPRQASLYNSVDSGEEYCDVSR